MKALNRAIARTVSQLGRYGREGCHPPMLMALESHLDALLALELKQVEVAGMKFASVPGDGPTIKVMVPPVKWTPEMVAAFNGMKPEHWHAPSLITGGRLPGKGVLNKLLHTPVEKWTSDQLKWFKAKVPLSNAEMDELDARWKAVNAQAEPPQPAPDAIDMADPRNWQVGDTVERGPNGSAFFRPHEECTVAENDDKTVRIKGNSGIGVNYPHRTVLDGAEHFFTWLRHGEAQQ